jgi:hypothetical protein
MTEKKKSGDKDKSTAGQKETYTGRDAKKGTSDFSQKPGKSGDRGSSKKPNGGGDTVKRKGD